MWRLVFVSESSIQRNVLKFVVNSGSLKYVDGVSEFGLSFI